MANSLIDIKNNKLILNTNIELDIELDTDIQIKVVSIIGKARTGKSSFLNCLISYWENDSKQVFQMSNTEKHCTNGIDIYYMKKQHILLLDFQGIWVENSSNDSKLLLLAYLMSDVIIFNEKQMLTNGTLAQFEPMLAFINDIKDKHDAFNPKLIFRVGDVSLHIDPTENMKQMLHPEDDQFMAIRECINDLFDDPYAIHTFILDRNEIALLNNSNFNELLKINENGFNTAIIKIEQYIACCSSNKTFKIFISDITKSIKNINENKKIDFKKLDVVKNLAKIEIGEWIEKLDKSIYAPLINDGTQIAYVKILDRKELLKITIKNLDKEFKSIPKTIRDDKIAQLKQDVEKVIELAENENRITADKLMLNLINNFLNIINTFNIELINLDINFDEWIKPFIVKLHIIHENSKHLYSVTLQNFKIWGDTQINLIKQSFETIVKNHIQLYTLYKIEAKNYLDIFRIIMTDDFNNVNTLTYNNLLLDYVNKYYTISINNDNIFISYKTSMEKFINENKQNFINYMNMYMKSKDIFYDSYTCYNYNYNTLNNKYDGIILRNIQVNIKHTQVNNGCNSHYKKFIEHYTQKITAFITSKECNYDNKIAKYRTNIMTKMGYIKIPEYIAEKNNNNNYSNILVNNNPNTKFYQIIYILYNLNSSYKFEHSGCMNVVTEEYYKANLEQVLLRTIKKLIDKYYLYDKEDKQFGGWIQVLNKLTKLELDGTKYNNCNIISLERSIILNCANNDYEKLILLDIFYHKLQKEFLKSNNKDYIAKTEYIDTSILTNINKL